MIRHVFFNPLSFLFIALTGVVEAGVVLEFDGKANAGRQWKDAPELRVRPEIEIRCRFRLDELRKGAQNLVTKDGEYLLRIDGHEAGHLSFFVQTDGNWEPRLRGPVVQADTWYNVHARWSGTELSMTVNGESFSRRLAGKIRPGSNPLTSGPLTGTIDRLEIHNPGFERLKTLSGLEDANPRAQTAFGSKAGWNGWQVVNEATRQTRNGDVHLVFPKPSSMFASPPLTTQLAHLPYISLEVEAPGTDWTGHLDFITTSGTGSIPFRPQDHGRPTLIPGAASEQWTGTLKCLGLRFSGGKGGVVLKKLELADRAVGTPWLYIRDLAAGRAKLRPGREETVIAAVKNLGGETENVRLRLRVPNGITILGSADQIIPYLGLNDFDMTSWRLRAKKPGVFEVTVDADAADAPTRSRKRQLVFEPMPPLPHTDYVPEPRPAKSEYTTLMHYCALWKEGTHWGWQKIEPWPNLRPAIGFYDEGTPEVADWHIKYALEHGVNAFIYCWYRAHLEPEIEHRLGHAIHDGLFKARYGDKFKFCLMWENGCAKGVKDEADLLDNLLPFWIKTYFTHSSYLKIDNRPVLFVWQPKRLIPQLGGPEGTRKALEAMRARCRVAGFKGLRIIACMDGLNPDLGRQIAESGWDAVSGYNLGTDAQPVGRDPAGLAYRDHADVLGRYKQIWIDRDVSTGNLPDIPNVQMGRDDRPWGRVTPGRGSYIRNPKAEHFEAACREAKQLVDAKPADRWDRGLVVLDNWTEFGEGHYIEPTSGTGFTFLNAIKRVFCTDWAPETVTDIVPADVGLEPPEKRYAETRTGFGRRMPWQPRRITGDLLAHWHFETLVDNRLTDSSPNDCGLAVTGMTLESGRGGHVLQCGTGEAVCPAPEPFFHTGGVTVALWCRPDRAKQSDRWMLNTVSKETNGYRLGLGGGRPGWQVPKTAWSHGLYAPEPLPVGTWSHVAATFDNRVMRLYVDGAEVASLERSGFINSSDQIVVGGYTPNLDRARFLGRLDDVRVYRRVLPSAEIAKLSTGATSGESDRKDHVVDTADAGDSIRNRSVSISKGFGIPLIDLSKETERQVIIEEGTEKVYQGHPTTVLLPDGKTMFAVWTYGHGGPCGPMKKSTDGGKTWSKLLPVPDSWREVKNCPAIYRLVDPHGKGRLFVFAVKGEGLVSSHSVDNGATWSEMKKMEGLNLTRAVMPWCSIIPIEGGKKLLAGTNARRANDPDRYSNNVIQSISEDGGLTWGPVRVICDLPGFKPCEPCFIRSPDGKQLLALLRENVRASNGRFIVSKDEGRTWSKPKLLQGALTGDRHQARYAPDGRLVVVFRDMASESPTRGHFVGWVGTYDDMLRQREGQYRLKLLHNHAGTDCGYPGLELLPDGTFVATTYLKYRPGKQKHSVVSTRFSLAELDRKKDS